jgi:hypothetical protein
MGLLLVGVLAGILIGFAWLAPSGHLEGCTFQWQGCFDHVADNRLAPRQAALPPGTASTSDPPRAQARSETAPKPAKHVSVALSREAARPKRLRFAVAERRPLETPDPVLEKAKVSVAAKMEDPTSAVFGDMDRAFRKNMFGRATDTICGHVRGKNASGGDTGERPFLYLVKEDDAYVVDGKPDSAASIAYRNICN